MPTTTYVSGYDAFVAEHDTMTPLSGRATPTVLTFR